MSFFKKFKGLVEISKVDDNDGQGLTDLPKSKMKKKHKSHTEDNQQDGVSSENMAVVGMGTRATRPKFGYSIAGAQLQDTETERDLGVNILPDLSPEMYIYGILRAVYAFLAIIMEAFRHMDKEMFRNTNVTYKD
ncbi:hypothetical protein SK128_005241 [Halocaridina rubra]|uniref:Uncharacterized protein n=1 Tax=Halocaridina rubra TaxID=373956 RepID=A0AAN8WRH9_HALRR